MEEITELEEIDTSLTAVLESSNTLSQVNDFFTKTSAEQIHFFGKSLTLWEDELAIDISSGELSPEDIRALHVTLIRNIQIAAHFYEMSRAANTISTNAMSIKKNQLISAIISHYHSIGQSSPPGTVMDKLADNYLQELNNVTNLNKLCKEYWKSKLQTLEKVQSNLQAISISQTMQNKYEMMGD